MYCGRLTRQQVADIEPDRALMRVLWGAARHVYVPRIAHEVRVLIKHLKRAVLVIPPQGVVKSEGDFLRGPVVAVCGTFVAVPDQRRAVGVKSGISLADD